MYSNWSRPSDVSDVDALKRYNSLSIATQAFLLLLTVRFVSSELDFAKLFLDVKKFVSNVTKSDIV